MQYVVPLRLKQRPIQETSAEPINATPAAEPLNVATSVELINATDFGGCLCPGVTDREVSHTVCDYPFSPVAVCTKLRCCDGNNSPSPEDA
jgi:hypothetical protein